MMKSRSKYKFFLDLANGKVTEKWVASVCKRKGWEMQPYEQSSPAILKVQKEILKALSILVFREAEGFFAGGGSITRKDLPLLYAIRESSSYRLDRRGQPKAEHGTNLGLFREELKQRVGSVKTFPRITLLAGLDFWEFMGSDNYLKRCSKCQKFFTTGDARNFFCSAKCYKSSRKAAKAESERHRTRTRLLNDIESYGIASFMGEFTLYENQGVKPVSKKGRRLIDRAKRCKLSSSELKKLFREAAKKARF